MFEKSLLVACFFCFHIQYPANGSPLTGHKVRYANKNEFPFIVSISRKASEGSRIPENNHLCGGTVITDKHILTAAHCFLEVKSVDDIVVKVNNRDLVKSKQYRVKDWITYDDWAHKKNISHDIKNDIAVIEIHGTVSSKVKPAELIDVEEDQLYGKRATIAGWGLIEGNTRPRFLVSGDVTILHSDKCIRNWQDDVKSHINTKANQFICTYARPAIDTQCGDSGSPLVIKPNKVIGVNKGCCLRCNGEKVLQRQNVHLSTNYYKTFICEVVTGHDRQPKCCSQ